MKIDGIFALASQQAAWLSVRQRTVAENIAQANIPGYLAKDTEPFRAMVAGSGTGLARTDPRHISTRGMDAGIKIELAGTGAGGKGERVNVETELMKSVEVRSGYETNTAIVKAFRRMLQTAVRA